MKNSDISRMQLVWFVYNHSSVQGPFTHSQLVELVRHGTFTNQDLVWRKGQKEWHTVQQWMASHSVAVEGTREEKPGEFTEAWYVSNGQMQQGPFTFVQLVDMLHRRIFSMSAKVWTNGLSRWIPVFEVHEILDALGISRREHLRVPLAGTASLQNTTEGVERHEVELLTLSTGGIGVKTALEPGLIVNIKIDSPLLSYPVQAQAQVVYTTSKDAGLQFTHVSSEMHAAIVEYINQFKGLEIPKTA